MEPETRSPTNVFANLLKYRPRSERTAEEDFFTEVVAAVLQYHPELFWHWIKPDWAAFDANLDVIEVTSQAHRRRLENHPSASRIDLVFKYTHHDGKDYVAYVESKIASGERKDQLAQYANHLLAEEDVWQRLLIYVTQRADPKEYTFERVPFRQVRWFELYRALKFIPQTPLISELKALMEHLRMDQDRSLTKADLDLARALPSTLTKLKEALDEIWELDLKPLTTRMKWSETDDYQLRTHGRAVFWNTTKANLWGGEAMKGLTLCVGFLLTEAEHPEVAVFLETPSRELKEHEWEAKKRLFSEFIHAHDESGWEIRHPNERYTKMIRSKPLSHFQSESEEDDSLSEVVNFLRDSLKQLKGENTR